MEAAQPVATAVRRTANPKYGTKHITKKPILIMLSGLPGTGKSYLAKRLGERLPCTIVESDAVRKKLFPRPSYNRKENTSVFRVIHKMIGDLLKNNISVILDATNLEEKHRKVVYQIAEGNGARLILLEVEAPPEVVEKRLKARSENRGGGDNSDATWATYQNLKRTAEKINRPHFNVSTAGNISAIIDKVVEETNR
jgi:predicted kinase